ncbi:MAG: hypothetical protein ACJ8R9_27475 [Steroidobacteraceae bacterium]
MLREFQRLALTFAAIATLAACGGGETSTPGTPSGTPGGTTPPPPVNTGKFSLELSTDKTVILQGSIAIVTVTLTRENGFDSAVQVSLLDLPTGVSANPATIAAGATTAMLTLNAPVTAPHSLPTAVTAKAVAGDLSATKSLTVTVRGLPGVLDTSFAGSKVITPVGSGEDYANAAAVQPDGRILVAGSSAFASGTQISLVRYDRDGKIDGTFGTAGKVTTAIGSSNDVATAIALQPDGKIVVVGCSDRSAAGTGYDFAMLRYNIDGRLDNGFGVNGEVLTDFNHGSDIAHAVLIQPDGKIVVGGEAMVAANTSGVDFAIARYNGDGSLDASFGNGGKLTTAVKNSSGTDVIYGLALQDVNGEKRILAVGGEGDFAAARYTPAGTLDAEFGSAGKIISTFNSSIGAAKALTVLPDGKAVLSGHMNNNFALVQLNLDGTLDTTFGTGGKVINPVSPTNWNQATAIARQIDGMLLVGGWVYASGSSGDFAIQRYTAAGVLDAEFGAVGTVVTPMANGTLSDQGHALVLQSDERVPTVRAIQVGEANGSNNDFAVARYWL